jgi:PhnB protein
MPVKYMPDGYNSVTPYLTVPGVEKVIAFLKETFGAEEKERFALPDGRIMHAEVKIGDSIVMMGEPTGQWQSKPANLYVYVKEIDNVYQRAVKAGGSSVMEPTDQFYGDRSCAVTDPAGNTWCIATHVEDVSRDEMEKRARAQAKKAA